MNTNSIALSIASQTKEITAAMELFVRMPKHRDDLAASTSMLMERLNENWSIFVRKRAAETNAA